MAGSSSAGSRGAGRPRDPEIASSALRVCLSELAERGYTRLSLESVAQLAETTKSALRRRWPVRQQLVIDALASVLVAGPVPDSGCTRCDLADTLTLLVGAWTEHLPAGVLAPLMADCAADPDLRNYLDETLLRPVSDVARVVVDRAVARGEIRAEVWAELVVELLSGLVVQRALLARPPAENRVVVEVVDMLLRGIAVDFDHLLAISANKPGHRHTP